MTDKEFIVEMRRRINPVYADCPNSESWERKRALEIIERRGADVERLQAQRDELLKFAQTFVEQYAGYQITNTKDAKHDAVGWLKDMASAAIANAEKDHECQP